MSTPYQKVFSAFLSRITDPFYGEMCQDIAEEDMLALLDEAILNFEFPRVDLTDKNDEEQIFNAELNFYVIQILGSLMASAWLRRQLMDIELLRQTMSPIEFQKYSQANHISVLTNLLEQTNIYVDSLKKKYSRREQGTSLFSRLGGGS